jgi:hypothetical protein
MSLERTMVNQPLTREQVLEELRFLTTVEHAVIVENLSLYCALGHDLPAEDGGATTQQGGDARDQGFVLAQGAMFRYKALQLALVEAGGAPELARATSISSASAAEISLGPPSLAQLERFLERAGAIASAVEERCAKLRAAVTSDPVFEGPLLEHLRAIVVEDAPTHTAALVNLRTLLPDGVPAELLRATRRQANDASSSASSTRATGSTTLSCRPFVSSSSTETSSSQGHFDPWQRKR